MPDASEQTSSDHRAADIVVRGIERDILSGDLPDRSPLPAERDLMVKYGTSRTVIREAITALSNRGLVENRPRFRPIARMPGYDTALDAAGGIVKHLLSASGGVRTLYDSRIFLERALARDAATSARKTDIENLKEALAANQAAIGDSASFHATDIAFHRVLYQVPDNPIFPAIHQAYTSWLAPHWEKMLRSPERNRVNYQSHKAIFDAIVERDPDAAEQALASHLNAAWEYVRVTFEADQT
ncbi:MAG: FCD domain-containing protein [Hyphomicrobiales bacterium]|nr:FCD domain-containing protein [Hyphomicrobiales bacterium]